MGLGSIHLVLISRVAPDVNIPMTEVMTWRELGLQDFDHPGEGYECRDVDDVHVRQITAQLRSGHPSEGWEEI